MHTDYFKHIWLDEEELESLYKDLIDKDYLDCRTGFSDFLYFTKGIGERPKYKMKWKASLTLLSIYIFEMGDACYRPEWCIAEQVFEGISATSIRDLHSACKSRNSSRSFNKFFNDSSNVRAFLNNL